MIYTSKKNNFNSTLPVISIDKECKGSYYSLLIPSNEELEELNKNKNSIEKSKLFIKKFYLKYLNNIDNKKLLNDLNNCIIISSEEFYEFSIRHIVSAYLELLYDIKIPEVKIDESGNITELYKPEYIKEEVKKLLLQSNNEI